MDAHGLACAALRARGAESVAHPGGDLLFHLVRTARLLESWGARPALALAGLCHAAYGTDGLPAQLFGLDERQLLVETVGGESEEIVYRYCSCQRSVVHPHLGNFRVLFCDRFTGETTTVTGAQLRDFVELTFANELDLVCYSSSFAAEHGAGIAALLGRCQGTVSGAAWHSLCVFLDSRHDR